MNGYKLIFIDSDKKLNSVWYGEPVTNISRISVISLLEEMFFYTHSECVLLSVLPCSLEAFEQNLK